MPSELKKYHQQIYADFTVTHRKTGHMQELIQRKYALLSASHYLAGQDFILHK